MTTLGETVKAKRRSLTLWVNSLAATLLPLLALAEDQLPGLRAALPPNVYAYAAFGLAIANFWLRMRTSQPVQPFLQRPKPGAVDEGQAP